jgi:uncharacterized membrane protein YqaE (UPF0057 family)
MDLGSLISDVSLLSSIAVIIGAVFVGIQIRQSNKTTNMDLIMRVYESANTAEVQSAWLTVLNSNITSYAEFEKLPKTEQLAFYQIAALFESLGVLVQRGIVGLDIIEDMFLTDLAWQTMKPFISGIRQKFGEGISYVAFEKLYNTITGQ